MKEKFSTWIHALRLYSFTTSLFPMLIGFAFVPEWDATLVFLIMACVFVIHAGTNMINDYYDYIYGVDQKHTLGSSRVLVEGKLTPTAMRNASLGCFAAGAVLGLCVILYTQRWAIAPFGLTALLICYFYSATKLQLKRRGLGDLGVFIAMGPLMTGGIYYTATGHWGWLPTLAGFIPGLLSVGVLHTNNLRDVESDRKVGLWNLAHIKSFGIPYWWGLLTTAYAIQLIMILFYNLSPYTLATFLLLFFLRPRIPIEKMALGHLLFNAAITLALFIRT